MKIFVETERLVLREIVEDDFNELYKLDADPDVHRYLGNSTITSKEKLMEAIDSIQQQYIDFGVGRWAMIDKNTNEFIGWTGLEYMTNKTNNHKTFMTLDTDY